VLRRSAKCQLGKSQGHTAAFEACTYPYCVLLQVTAVVGDAVGMFEASQESGGNVVQLLLSPSLTLGTNKLVRLSITGYSTMSNACE
jgi:hypothetical protein